MYPGTVSPLRGAYGDQHEEDGAHERQSALQPPHRDEEADEGDGDERPAREVDVHDDGLDLPLEAYLHPGHRVDGRHVVDAGVLPQVGPQAVVAQLVLGNVGGVREEAKVGGVDLQVLLAKGSSIVTSCV